MPWHLKVVAFHHEHPKWDQNLWFFRSIPNLLDGSSPLVLHIFSHIKSSNVVNCVVSVLFYFLLRLVLVFENSKESTLLMCTCILCCLLNSGRVVRADIMTESSGRSKGCGTVLFETSEDAAHAISILLTCKYGLL